MVTDCDTIIVGAGLADRVEGLLKCGGIVGAAVAHSTAVTDVKRPCKASC